MFKNVEINLGKVITRILRPNIVHRKLDSFLLLKLYSKDQQRR